MWLNPTFRWSPILTLFGLGPWAIIHGLAKLIGKYFYLNFDGVIWKVSSKSSEFNGIQVPHREGSGCKARWNPPVCGQRFRSDQSVLNSPHVPGNTLIDRCITHCMSWRIAFAWSKSSPVLAISECVSHEFSLLLSPAWHKVPEQQQLQGTGYSFFYQKVWNS